MCISYTRLRKNFKKIDNKETIIEKPEKYIIEFE